MNKIDMREWVASLEVMLDNKLKKWHKFAKWENGENVQLRWQYEQTHIQLDVFWENGVETVRLKYLSPRGDHDFMWHGLTDKTFNRIQDRVGNLAMTTLHPPIDPEDHE